MMPRKPDRRDAEGARAYAIQNAETLDQWAALFMNKLGIDRDRIGASDRKRGVAWRAFFPHEQDGGGNSPGQRLNLDSGIFNDDLMQPLGMRADRAWRRASVETRAMAVLRMRMWRAEGTRTRRRWRCRRTRSCRLATRPVNCCGSFARSSGGS